MKLLGKSVSYRTIHQRMRDLWRLDHGFELTDLEDGYFIVRFFSPPDYLHVLEGGPWIILGHYLTVMKWRLKFRPVDEKMSKTLVWVRFSGILPELLEEEILSSMGDMLGRTIRVDNTSLSGTRGKFARVCVELDLATPLLPSLTLFDFAQRVEYEGLHLICFECGRYDHRGEDCLMAHPPSNPSVPPSTPPVPPSPVVPEPPSSLYGPWMLANYRKKALPPRWNVWHASTAPPPAKTSRVPQSQGPSVGPSRAMETPRAAQVTTPRAAAVGFDAAGGSQFQSLAGLQDEVDIDSTVAQLKQQIQAFQGPGSRRRPGSTHGCRGSPRPSITPPESNPDSLVVRQPRKHPPGRSGMPERLKSKAVLQPRPNPQKQQHQVLFLTDGTSSGGASSSLSGKSVAMEVDASPLSGT